MTDTLTRVTPVRIGNDRLTAVHTQGLHAETGHLELVLLTPCAWGAYAAVEKLAERVRAGERLFPDVSYQPGPGAPGPVRVAPLPPDAMRRIFDQRTSERAFQLMLPDAVPAPEHPDIMVHLAPDPHDWTAAATAEEILLHNRPDLITPENAPAGLQQALHDSGYPEGPLDSLAMLYISHAAVSPRWVPAKRGLYGAELWTGAPGTPNLDFPECLAEVGHDDLFLFAREPGRNRLDTPISEFLHRPGALAARDQALDHWAALLRYVCLNAMGLSCISTRLSTDGSDPSDLENRPLDPRLLAPWIKQVRRRLAQRTLGSALRASKALVISGPDTAPRPGTLPPESTPGALWLPDDALDRSPEPRLAPWVRPGPTWRRADSNDLAPSLLESVRDGIVFLSDDCALTPPHLRPPERAEHVALDRTLLAMGFGPSAYDLFAATVNQMRDAPTIRLAPGVHGRNTVVLDADAPEPIAPAYGLDLLGRQTGSFLNKLQVPCTAGSFVLNSLIGKFWEVFTIDLAADLPDTLSLRDQICDAAETAVAAMEDEPLDPFPAAPETPDPDHDVPFPWRSRDSYVSDLSDPPYTGDAVWVDSLGIYVSGDAESACARIRARYPISPAPEFERKDDDA